MSDTAISGRTVRSSVDLWGSAVKFRCDRVESLAGFVDAAVYVI